MNIVVDTNILVRILISPDGLVADLFYPLREKHDLFISYSSIEEINKHKTRLLKLSGLGKKDFDLLLTSMLNGITIISLDQISDTVLLRSFLFITGLDYDNVPFVATALFANAYLWTSDKELFFGLKKKGFDGVLNNTDIKKILKQS